MVLHHSLHHDLLTDASEGLAGLGQWEDPAGHLSINTRSAVINI